MILTEGLARASALVLLQTKGMLMRPGLLLELQYATRYRIPIIPLRIKGRDYELGRSEAFLDNLEISLE